MKAGRIQKIGFIGLTIIVLAMVIIVGAGLNDQVANADLIVVPGNTVGPDGKPSARLQARLDATLQLFRDRKAPLIFVSGGTGKEGFDEARSMSAYLVAQGVPQHSIINDNAGVDTEATAHNAAVFMREHDLKTALVATQYFHIVRTKLALERNGVDVVGTMHARFFEVRDLYSIPREVVAYAKYLVKAGG